MVAQNQVSYKNCLATITEEFHFNTKQVTTRATEKLSQLAFWACLVLINAGYSQISSR